MTSPLTVNEEIGSQLSSALNFIGPGFSAVNQGPVMSLTLSMVL
jgi:hypothetical protein